MTAFQEQAFVVREPANAPDGLAGGVQGVRPVRVASHRRPRLGDGLARRILARLPLAVAVIDADAHLSFWNEQASLLFGSAPWQDTGIDVLPSRAGRGGHRVRAGDGVLDRLQSFTFNGLALGAEPRCDADRTRLLTAGIAEVLRLHASVPQYRNST